jgi:hypothetical protein
VFLVYFGKTLNLLQEYFLNAMSEPKQRNSALIILPLFVLRLLVYSNSLTLTMTFLSLYGYVEGIAKVPRKRVSTIKSLLSYGASVLEHGLGYTA